MAQTEMKDRRSDNSENRSLLSPGTWRVFSMRTAAVSFGVAVPLLVMGRAAIAMALLVTCLCLVFGSDRKTLISSLKSWRSAPIAAAVSIVLISWLPGVLASPEPAISAGVWLRTAIFIAIAALCSGIIGRQRQLPALTYKALIVASWFALAAAILALAIYPEIIAYVRLQPNRAFDAARALKSYANAGMLLVPPLLVAVYVLRGTWRWLAGSAALFAVVVVFATYSKSPMVGLLAILGVVVVCAIITFRRKRYRLLLAAICLVAGSAVLVNVSGRLDKVNEKQSAQITAEFSPYVPLALIDIHRQAIWAFAFERALSSPWLGHGINRSNFIAGSQFNIIGIPGGRGGEFIPSHPHNWLLEIFLETGGIGALATLIAVVWFHLSLFRRYLAGKDPMVLAILATTAGYWASGLFNFSFWSAWWQVAYLVTIALMFANARIILDDD